MLWGTLWQAQDLGCIHPPSLSEAAGAQLTFLLQAAVWVALRYQMEYFHADNLIVF